MMSNEEIKDHDGYYSCLLGRIVRQPSRVLYDMIKKLGSDNDKRIVDQMIKKLGNENDKRIVNQICSRCKTHPDDVNWVDDYNMSSFCEFTPMLFGDNAVKICKALTETDSFRVFDELDRMKKKNLIYKAPSKYLLAKLVPMKAIDIMEIFQKHNLSFDMAKVITSYLYGKKRQMDVLHFILRSCFHDKHHACHLIDEWITLDTEVLSNEGLFFIMIDSIQHCTKDCCALMFLRNVKKSFELARIESPKLYLLEGLIRHCLRNACICLNVDLVDLSIEILAIAIEKFGEKMLVIDLRGRNILHNIARSLQYPNSDEFTFEKWLSFLGKILDQFPPELLSIRDVHRKIPCDMISSIFTLWGDKRQDQVFDLFEPH